MKDNLTNVAAVKGYYNNIELALTSNQVVTELVSQPNVSVLKNADKYKWYRGNLTYTIAIKNLSSSAYENFVVRDFLDTSKISLVVDSIRINGVPYYPSLNPNKQNSKLEIPIDILPPESTCLVTFQVKKNYLSIFLLKNMVELQFSDIVISSNVCEVIALEKIEPYSNCCTPCWRG